MKIPDERIISVLLSTRTNREAAQKIGISERVLYARMSRPEFRRKLAAARQNILENAATSLVSRINDATKTTTEIMLNPLNPAQTRLNAASEVLRYALKLNEQINIEQRLSALESEIENINEGGQHR